MESNSCPARICVLCRYGIQHGSGLVSSKLYVCKFNQKKHLGSKAKKCSHFSCKRKGDYAICSRCSG